MKVDDSILKTVRKSVVGVEDNLEFDIELIPYINSSILNLNQNGVGARIIVEDDKTTWGDLMGTDSNRDFQSYKSIPLYMALNTKLLFDPPPPSAVQYHSNTITELLWRLKVEFEDVLIDGVDPTSRFAKEPWKDEKR